MAEIRISALALAQAWVSIQSLLNMLQSVAVRMQSIFEFSH